MRTTVCRRAATLLCAAALAAAAAACGGEAGDGPASETPTPVVPSDPLPTATAEATEMDETTLRGRLGGDAQLEGGCAWVQSGRQRFEVLWPQGYEVRFDPLRLLGPGGDIVARGGETVVVSGAPAEGAFSVCQIGPIWQATAVTTP